MESSRSHAVMTLALEQHAKDPSAAASSGQPTYLKSKFHLVDLAGSERQKDTRSTGEKGMLGASCNPKAAGGRAAALLAVARCS